MPGDDIVSFPILFSHTPSPTLWFLPCSCTPSCLNLSILSILFLYVHFTCTPLSPHTFSWLFGSSSFWLSLGSACFPQASLNKILWCECVPPEFLCWKRNPQTHMLMAFLDVAFEKKLASFEVMRAKAPWWYWWLYKWKRNPSYVLACDSLYHARIWQRYTYQVLYDALGYPRMQNRESDKQPFIISQPEILCYSRKSKVSFPSRWPLASPRNLSKMSLWATLWVTAGQLLSLLPLLGVNSLATLSIPTCYTPGKLFLAWRDSS